ncbi:hypothetical protein L798_01019 [Zootermopsis nevadensis]|uniref:Uncharacterized protein n=1 Tax=Zootermopsis nevadensis TaxID=136037 RepID=A0A067QK47_ZOONE|nr:hypothetical protein L798_01019 [Zootermopsis nevadensis]
MFLESHPAHTRHSSSSYGKVSDGTPISRNLRSCINCLRLISVKSTCSAKDLFIYMTLCPLMTFQTFWTQSIPASVRNGFSFCGAKLPIVAHDRGTGQPIVSTVSHASPPRGSPPVLIQLPDIVFS